MKRLREEIDSPDPLLAEAARLLVSLPPVESSPGRRARIWAALSRRRGPRQGILSIRWALRSAVLVPLVLLALATVATALWAGVLAPRAGKLERQEDGGRRSSIAPVRGPATPPPAPPASPDPEPPPLEQPIPPAEPPRSPSPKRQAPLASRAQAPSPEADVAFAFAPSAEDEPESALVLGAFSALRRDHDPRRAGAMLEEYLRLHPRGALVEEALALAIEAAAARDDSRAGSLAVQYLERFPEGRFRLTAQRARGRFGPTAGPPPPSAPGGSQ